MLGTGLQLFVEGLGFFASLRQSLAQFCALLGTGLQLLVESGDIVLDGLTPVALNLKSLFARRGCGAEGFFGETEGGCQGVKCIYVQCFTAASAQGFAISLRDPRVKRINTRIMKRGRRVGIPLEKCIDVCLGCAVRLG